MHCNTAAMVAEIKFQPEGGHALMFHFAGYTNVMDYGVLPTAQSLKLDRRKSAILSVIHFNVIYAAQWHRISNAHLNQSSIHPAKTILVHFVLELFGYKMHHYCFGPLRERAYDTPPDLLVDWGLEYPTPFPFSLNAFGASMSVPVFYDHMATLEHTSPHSEADSKHWPNTTECLKKQQLRTKLTGMEQHCIQ